MNHEHGIPRRRVGELMSSVTMPAAVLTVLLVGPAFLWWQAEMDRREGPLRREIARNFAEKWGRCDLAERFDKTIPCSPRTVIRPAQ